MRVLAINSTYDSGIGNFPSFGTVYTPSTYKSSEINSQINHHRNVLRSIPNVDFCISYTEALKKLTSNNSYDLIVTSCTPQHIQHPFDQYNIDFRNKKEYKELYTDRENYSIAMSYLQQIKHINGYAKFVIYSGCAPHWRNKIVQTFQKITPHYRFVSKSLSLEDDKTDIQSNFFELLCELQVNLNPDGTLQAQYGLSRAAVQASLGESQISIIGVPHIPMAVKYKALIKEFEHLINDPRTTEERLHKFLNRYPEILLGQRYKSLRTKVILKRDEDHSLIPDFILEPVNQHDFWKIIELKLPQKNITKSPKNRAGFNQQVCNAINQMKDYRNYFDNPVYRRNMENQGISAYKPMLSLIIGNDYGKLLPSQTIESKIMHASNNIEIMTYSDLIDQVKQME